MKYYNLLRAWHVRNDFSFVNSHDKLPPFETAAGGRRYGELWSSVWSIQERHPDFRRYCTRFDTNWVPQESLVRFVDDAIL